MNNYAYLGNFTAITILASGLQIFLDTREWNSMNLVTYGRYERDVEDVIRKFVKKNNVVIDIGANVGYHTLTSASIVGKDGLVFAFEPNPRLFPLLFRSVGNNGFKSRTKLFKKAVFNENSKRTLTWDEGNHRCGRIVSKSTELSKMSTEVETVILDDVIEDNFFPVNLMKIDVEGSEPFVLEGAKRVLENSPNLKLIMEWDTKHMKERGYDINKFMEFLKNYDFKIFRIEGENKLPFVKFEDLPELEPSNLLFEFK